MCFSVYKFTVCKFLVFTKPNFYIQCGYAKYSFTKAEQVIDIFYFVKLS